MDEYQLTSIYRQDSIPGYAVQQQASHSCHHHGPVFSYTEFAGADHVIKAATNEPPLSPNNTIVINLVDRGLTAVQVLLRSSLLAPK